MLCVNRFLGPYRKITRKPYRHGKPGQLRCRSFPKDRIFEKFIERKTTDLEKVYIEHETTKLFFVKVV